MRLPHNVFAPYIDIQSNIIFFERGEPTQSILYCEPSFPLGYSLSKTKPLLYEWMEPLKTLIASRQETDTSWLDRRDDLDENLNLDIKNPRRKLNSLADRGNLETLSAQMRSYADEADAIKAELAQVTELIRQSPWELLDSHTYESDERIGEDYSPEMPLLGVSAEEGITNPKTAIGKSPERYKCCGRITWPTTPCVSISDLSESSATIRNKV